MSISVVFMHDRFFLIQNHYDLQIVSIKESAVFVKKRRWMLFRIADCKCINDFVKINEIKED